MFAPTSGVFCHWEMILVSCSSIKKLSWNCCVNLFLHIFTSRFSHQTPAVEALLDSSLSWHFSTLHLFTPQAFTTIGLPKSFVREMLFRQHCLDVKEIPNKGKPAMKKEAPSH
ncbi:hypothetical protein DsansV1_C13g0116941 [Dioscorea sansibarensis]